MLKVSEPVKDLSQKAVDYRTYRFIRQPARYNEEVAYEIHHMAKKTAVQIKDRALYGKDPYRLLLFYRISNQPATLVELVMGPQCGYSNNNSLDPPKQLLKVASH